MSDIATFEVTMPNYALFHFHSKIYWVNLTQNLVQNLSLESSDDSEAQTLYHPNATSGYLPYLVNSIYQTLFKA